jgi:signal transduction histidine kinase
LGLVIVRQLVRMMHGEIESLQLAESGQHVQLQ